MPLLLRNQLAPAAAARSLMITVLDRRGRATRAGAVVRVYSARSKRLLATRLVDSGSGYNSQSDLPVHVGLPAREAVDVQVTVPGRGAPTVTWQRGIPSGRRAIAVRTR